MQTFDAEKEKQRVMRHVARPAVYRPPAVLSPEKRAYMKRFGSRPAKKRRNKMIAVTEVIETVD